VISPMVWRGLFAGDPLRVCGGSGAKAWVHDEKLCKVLELVR